jgi:hypothetical protein
MARLLGRCLKIAAAIRFVLDSAYAQCMVANQKVPWFVSLKSPNGSLTDTVFPNGTSLQHAEGDLEDSSHPVWTSLKPIFGSDRPFIGANTTNSPRRRPVQHHGSLGLAYHQRTTRSLRR